MKTFTLLVAFAALYVASSDAGIVRRQADKGRRLVRVRGRQREDRQLFLEPLPLAASPGPLILPAAAPVAQPIQLVEIRQQQQQPAQLVEIRQPIAANYEGPEVTEVREVATSYGGPEVTEVREVAVNYGSPQPEATEVVEVPDEIVEVRDEIEEPVASYGAADVRAASSYASPLSAAATQIVEVRKQPAVFTVPQTIASERNILAKPVAITRSVYNAPGARLGNDNWDYAFESENGIKQEATGEMRLVGDSEVVVMRGSYEYIGADNNVYVVEWEADENGFRPSAAHLPKSVPIPFPEQQEAVNAQIRFAAEEDELNLRAAASNLLPAYASALPAYSN